MKIRLAAFALFLPFPLLADATFQAGAAAVDISPVELPAIRNGGFLEARSDRIDDPLFARCLVLADGEVTLAIAVVDSCMLPTDVCDAIKARVAARIDLPTDRILVAATHTHSAPSAMEMCLGTRADPAYTKLLVPKVAEGIVAAHAALRPARAAWGGIDAPEFTANRRWIRRSDRVRNDPFGEPTVRANMHPGHGSVDAVGPSGPVDPELSFLSIETADGEPLCLLANFSMHYFSGNPGFSADYFGEVARRFERELGGGSVVGVMSQGTSGDLWWGDYSLPKRRTWTRAEYSRRLADLALGARGKLVHRADLDLAMAETRMPLRLRVPSASRLAWARRIDAARGDRRPRNKPEVYAEQAIWMDANPRAEIVLQALRVGDLGIASLPTETYALTGLKLKAWSPLEHTFTMSLANGADGYIPPPEQHVLGGYNTWPARTAGLETNAEPRMVEALVALLETVAGKPRRAHRNAPAPYPDAVMADRPIAYWRLNDLAGFVPTNEVPGVAARFEDGVALYLPGVQREGGHPSAEPEIPSPFCGEHGNRACHHAGGRLVVGSPALDDQAKSGSGAGRAEARPDIPGLKAGLRPRYSVEFWFWNGFPTDARPITGYLFSRGRDGDAQAVGEHLGIGGTAKDTIPGRLFFYTGNEVGTVVNGSTELAFRDWHHVVLVRDGDKLAVHLDGVPEIEAEVAWTLPAGGTGIFLGGRCDRFAGFEGKIDEVAIYDRPLSAKQVRAHFAASERVPPPRTRLESEPRDPRDAKQSIHVPEGFELDLVAAEPLVMDPVAFDWDTDGRLWVAEMADYPNGRERGGRLRVLTDTDSDGTYDTGKVVAAGLNFPNGVMTWRDGALVTAAPDVLHIREDGHVEKLISGLSQGNQQLRANGLRWGLDGWVHVASGGHHPNYPKGTVLTSHRAGIDVEVGSRDFRFRPDSGELEPAAGPTQFGRNRDDWGHWFGTQNARPLWHYVLPDHYLRRNPHLAAPDGRVMMFPTTQPPVHPASKPQKRYHGFDHKGRYTSACSGAVYRDKWLGTNATAFVCEPFHNLVQRIALHEDGVSFRGERVGGEFDFFASEDRWCRPVMVRTGPDGAVWIADMYRYMIEHPAWLPPKGRADLLPHYRQGEDRGRVWRVRPPGLKAGPVPKLPHDADLGRVRNGWLHDKHGQVHGIGFVSWNTIGHATSPEPFHRFRALLAMAHNPRYRDWIANALRDPHAGIRENALRWAEANPSEQQMELALDLVDDPSPKVRLQLAFTLGEFPPGEAVAAALAKLLREDEPFIVTAALSSALPHLAELAAVLGVDHPHQAVLAAMALDAGNEAALAGQLRAVFNRTRTEPPGGYAGGHPTDTLDLLDLLARRGRSVPAAARAAHAAMMRDAKANLGVGGRWSAALLARDPAERDEALAWLRGNLRETGHPETLRLLSGCDEPRHFGVAVFRAWPKLGPTTRGLAVDLLLGHAATAEILLRQVAEGGIDAAAVPETQRMRLRRHPEDAVRERATALWPAPPDRAAVVARYATALAEPGDAAAGRKIFATHCAACHRRGELGSGDIGPDLGGVAAHSADKLLSGILDPNADIQPGYRAVLCTLRGGGQCFGRVVAENAASVTIQQLDGTTRSLLRRDIGTLKSLGQSLMPEGLEAGIDPRQMADLIAFLQGER